MSQGTISSIDSVADAIALEVVGRKTRHKYLLAGSGCRLKVFQPDSGQQVLNQAVLQGAKIHGIKSILEDEDGAFLLIYGQRQLAVLKLSTKRALATGDDENSNPLAALKLLSHFKSLPDWVMDAESITISPAREAIAPGNLTTSSCVIAIGYINNFVQFWQLDLNNHADAPTGGSQGSTALLKQVSSVQLLLYSMALKSTPRSCDSEATLGTVAVVSGTIFHTILVWTAQADTRERAASRTQECQPIFKLEGHVGSIHKLRWESSLGVILSAADDRTARVWRLPGNWWQEPTKTSPGELVHTLWGHKARVWDALCVGSYATSPLTVQAPLKRADANYPRTKLARRHSYQIPHCFICRLILTAAEDGHLILWNVYTGEQITSIQAHISAPAWCCAAIQAPLVASGGGDCSLKLWDLSQWLPPQLSSLVTDPSHPRTPPPDPNSQATPAPPTPQFTAQLPKPTPNHCHGAPARHTNTKEGIVAISLSAPDTAYIATSTGRTMLVDLAREDSISPAGELSSTSWETVTNMPGNIGPLSCCTARRTVQNSRAFTDVVVCGSRCPGVTVAVVQNSGGGHKVGATVHAQLCDTESSIGAIVGVFLPASLPQSDVLCGDCRGTLWWLSFPHLFGRQHCTGLDVRALASCHCQAKGIVTFVELVTARQLLMVGNSLGHIGVFRVEDTGAPAEPVRLTHQYSFSAGQGTAPVMLIQSSAFELVTGGRTGTLKRWALCDDTTCRNNGQPVVRECVQELRLAVLSSVIGFKDVASPGRARETLVAGFKGSEFVVWDAHNDVEVVRTSSGGWRRPVAVHLASSSEFVVVLLKEQRLKIIRKAPVRLGPPAGLQERASVLQPAHHSKIIHSCACLQLSGGIMAAVTVSEDGAVRVLTYRCNKRGVAEEKTASILAGKPAAGHAIRCLHASMLPMHNTGDVPKYIVFSAGSKEVQSAWDVSMDSNEPQVQYDGSVAEVLAQSRAGCRASWLATLPPPKGGFKPRHNAQGNNSLEAEQRTLAICSFICPGSSGPKETESAVYVIHATSGGKLKLQRFDLRFRAWFDVLELLYDGFVILSVDVVVRWNVRGCEVIVAAGGSNGDVTFWDVSQSLHAQGSAVAPCLRIPGVHQTGVNSLQLREIDEERLWAVTGGDDQALAVVVMRKDSCATSETLMLHECLRVPNAHHSAVKGLCCEMLQGRLHVWSIGWDEFLRFWHISPADQVCENPSTDWEVDAKSQASAGLRESWGSTVMIREVCNHVVDVCEPCCVAGCCAADGTWNVVVSGRGFQLLSLLAQAPCSDSNPPLT